MASLFVIKLKKILVSKTNHNLILTTSISHCQRKRLYKSLLNITLRSNTRHSQRPGPSYSVATQKSHFTYYYWFMWTFFSRRHKLLSEPQNVKKICLRAEKWKIVFKLFPLSKYINWQKAECLRRKWWIDYKKLLQNKWTNFPRSAVTDVLATLRPDCERCGGSMPSPRPAVTADRSVPVGDIAPLVLLPPPPAAVKGTLCPPVDDITPPPPPWPMKTWPRDFSVRCEASRRSRPPERHVTGTSSQTGTQIK